MFESLREKFHLNEFPRRGRGIEYELALAIHGGNPVKKGRGFTAKNLVIYLSKDLVRKARLTPGVDRLDIRVDYETNCLFLARDPEGYTLIGKNNDKAFRLQMTYKLGMPFVDKMTPLNHLEINAEGILAELPPTKVSHSKRSII